MDMNPVNTDEEVKLIKRKAKNTWKTEEPNKDNCCP